MDGIDVGGGTTNTTTNRRRKTGAKAGARGRKNNAQGTTAAVGTTGRRGRAAGTIPQASAGVGGGDTTNNVTGAAGLRAHMLSDLVNLRGYTRQQINAAFPGLGSNW
jgi:hypothetical protein